MTNGIDKGKLIRFIENDRKMHKYKWLQSFEQTSLAQHINK